jgi:photosystem II stability/assembly factor-like uncharacterized protein
MRKAILILHACLVTTILLAADWSWQHPKPQGNTLWKTAFANERCCFAVGDHGTILATVNAGATWEIQYEGITDHLRDVFIIDSVTAWIAGDNGIILRTTDGGTRWIEQQSGTANGLNSIFFHDQLNGWAGGDARTLLRTTNGGIRWDPQSLPSGIPNPNTVSINGIWFSSPSDGWVVGSNGLIVYTTNGGSTWTVQQSSGETCLRVKFSSATTGFAVGTNGTIYSTSNAGSAWSKSTTGLPSGLNDLCFLSQSDIWVVGDDGTAFHSTNGGVS